MDFASLPTSDDHARGESTTRPYIQEANESFGRCPFGRCPSAPYIADPCTDKPSTAARSTSRCFFVSSFRDSCCAIISQGALSRKERLESLRSRRAISASALAICPESPEKLLIGIALSGDALFSPTQHAHVRTSRVFPPRTITRAEKARRVRTYRKRTRALVDVPLVDVPPPPTSPTPAQTNHPQLLAAHPDVFSSLPFEILVAR